jgi:Kdo2-lipid IVA lauroyltransferase/acyltransferase
MYGATLNAFARATGNLPTEAATGVGKSVGAFAYRCSRVEADRARGNIARAFPGLTADDVDALARACFQHLGAAFVDVLRFDRLSESTLDDVVDARGLEVVREALSRGCGCVVVTAHYGNWEMFGATLALSGLNVVPVVRELRSRTLDRWVDGRRRMVGMTPASRQRSLRLAVEALKANDVVLMLPDVDTTGRGVFVDFFGKPAYTPVGPALLSARYGAPLVTGFLTRRDGERHLAEIAEPIETRGDADADLLATTTDITARIEAQIRRHPEQWIWMHRRWQTRPTDER